MRIAVAMSGGVDSSTAAALLVEQGHEVLGLTIKTHSTDGAVGAVRTQRACCTPDDLRDARRVADQLDIPFYVLNYEELFLNEVIRPFAEAYWRGETPNPCVTCNEKIKFGPLWQRAKLLGAEALATGHYARVAGLGGFGRDGAELWLRRAKDQKKDQSYFLYRLSQEELSFARFPLGEMTKEEVRGHARRLGLKTSEKPESQEICFVGPKGYAHTVERVLGREPTPGVFTDSNGIQLGSHQGVHHFTIGQRRGLGIAAKEPLYVVDIRAEQGLVQLGSRQDLLSDRCVAGNFRWSHAAPNKETEVFVQQRYREPPKSARLESYEGEVCRFRLAEPQVRAAPGQVAVVYAEDRVLGGGVVRLA